MSEDFRSFSRFSKFLKISKIPKIFEISQNFEISEDFRNFSRFYKFLENSRVFNDSKIEKKPKIIQSLSEIWILFKMTNSHRKKLNPEWKFYYNFLEMIVFCLKNSTEKCRRVGLQFENTKWHSHKT